MSLKSKLIQSYLIKSELHSIFLSKVPYILLIFENANATSLLSLNVALRFNYFKVLFEGEMLNELKCIDEKQYYYIVDPTLYQCQTLKLFNNNNIFNFII
jgi:hypothetical protein